MSLTLLNRKAFVGAVSNLSSLPADKTLTVKLGKEKPPSVENFDFGADYTIIENPKKTMVSAKLFGAAYSRPEQVRPPPPPPFGQLAAFVYVLIFYCSLLVSSRTLLLLED